MGWGRMITQGARASPAFTPPLWHLREGSSPEHQVGPWVEGRLGMPPVEWISRAHGHIPPRHLAKGLITELK